MQLQSSLRPLVSGKHNNTLLVSWGAGNGSRDDAISYRRPTTSAPTIRPAHRPSAFLDPSGNRLGIPRSKAGELVALTEPVSRLDVDKELWEVLDLCSDDELETIYNILFGTSPFSPVVKSIVKEDEPPLLQLRGRTSIMHKVTSLHLCC